MCLLKIIDYLYVSIKASSSLLDTGSSSLPGADFVLPDLPIFDDLDMLKLTLPDDLLDFCPFLELDELPLLFSYP